MGRLFRDEFKAGFSFERGGGRLGDEGEVGFALVLGHWSGVSLPKAFMTSGWIWRQYLLTIRGAWILFSGSQELSDVGYPFHLTR